MMLLRQATHRMIIRYDPDIGFLYVPSIKARIRMNRADSTSARTLWDSVLTMSIATSATVSRGSCSSETRTRLGMGAA
jgi:hypothetical protein